MSKKPFLVAAVAGLMSPLALTAHASSVGFAGLPKLAGGNDVTAQLVDVQYTASTGEFKTLSVAGFNQTTALNGASFLAAQQGAFSFDVFLTSAGAVDTTKGGSLSVLGGTPNTTILFSSSSFLAFGYDNVTGTPIHMLFGPGSQGLGTSGPIGVNLTGTVSGFSDFNHDFGGMMLMADTFNAVPLPSAATLGIAALPLLAFMLRRRVQTANV